MVRLVALLVLTALTLVPRRTLLASEGSQGAAAEAGLPATAPAPVRPTFSLAPNPVRLGAPLFLTLTLPEPDWAAFEVFDISGRRVASRPLERLVAGRVTRSWDPGLWRPGLYLVRWWTGSRDGGAARLVVLR